jgi:phosphofructokinase-like protein
MRFGVLTGGGDCPGLNAVIRAIVRTAWQRHGHEVLGARYGWRGVLEGDWVELDVEKTRGILHRGGTILGSSRSDPAWFEEQPGDVAQQLAAQRLDGLIAIGGDGTLRVAANLAAAGLPVIGVPKTIDNDIGGTDVTFGFDTAVQIASDAIDRLHSTAESHNRVLIVEVMGRHSGWIALHAGLAGGADAILVPEQPVALDEISARLRERAEHGRRFSIVVVAEGVALEQHDDGALRTARVQGHGRLGGVAHRLAEELERRTGFETRATVLGHVQRGGTPTAFDRVLATRLGVAAAEAAHERRWGAMPGLRGQRVELTTLREAIAHPRVVQPDDLAVAEAVLAPGASAPASLTHSR